MGHREEHPRPARWKAWSGIGAITALTLLILLAVATGARAEEEPPCPEDQGFAAAEAIEAPLPALSAISLGCGSFTPPTASFMVGQDGLTYYIELEPSSGCAAADEELRRWLSCWTYQPGRCDGEDIPTRIETTLAWQGGEGGAEPPCERGEEPEGGLEDPP